MGKFLSWLGDNALGLLGLAGSGISAIVNAEQQKMQNAYNERLVDKQNAAAAAESEKQRAYESAPAQVSRLRSAGMSKAGALGAINGAGGYTPAPVNASQGTAPQIDSSNIVNALQGMAQLSEQKRVNDAVIKKTNADAAKSNIEAQKLDIEKKAEELAYSSNEEIRKYFPALRDYLSSSYWAPDMRGDKDLKEFHYMSSDNLWQFLKSENNDLYNVVARNSEMRDYVDNYFSYKFADYMDQLGFTTTLTQAKALRQQVNEYLSGDAVSLRDKKLALELALAQFEQDYYKGSVTGNDSIDNLISKFRMWSKTALGEQVTSTMFELGETLIKSFIGRKRMPRKPPKT